MTVPAYVCFVQAFREAASSCLRFQTALRQIPYHFTD